MLPVGTKLALAGSNSSVVASPPPATSTLPFLNRVAVCPLRGVLILPVRTKWDDEAPTTEEITLKLTEFEVRMGTSPILSQISTKTVAMTALFNKSAGTTTTSCVPLTEEWVNTVSLPFADHFAIAILWGSVVGKVNFDAVMVSGRSALPATAPVGEIEIETEDDPGEDDPGAEDGKPGFEPPPQP